MKIKVGQYVRLTNNKIVKLEEDLNTPKDMSRNDIYMNKAYEGYITKVADTPIELIEVGDLVWYKHIANEPSLIKDKDELEWLLKWAKLITKILTPNSNGDYIKQWELN